MNNREKALIIYHRSDFDGVMSGIIAKEACSYFGLAEPVMLGFEYGDKVPTSAELADYKLVEMVDLCVSGVMNAMTGDKLGPTPPLVWIDHHASAIRQYGDAKQNGSPILGCRIDGVAACRLAWNYHASEGQATKEEYVNREVEEPLMVRLLGEYDVWDHRDPRAKEFNFGLRTYTPDVAAEHLRSRIAEAMDSFIDSGESFRDLDEHLEFIYNTCQRGRLVFEYEDANYRLAANSAYTVRWQGLTFCVMNGQGNSLSFKYAVRPYHDALMKWTCKGDRVVVSLYAIDGKDSTPDLSVLATEMGGGGHPRACGFQASLDFLKRLELISFE